MDPITGLLVLSLFSAAGSSGYGQYLQNKQLKYQAKVAENNAVAAGYEAEYAKEQAQKDAQNHRDQVAKLLGKQRAAMGASGMVADTGSFLDLELDTVSQGKMDELAILHEGDLEAWRAKVGASNQTAQAQLYRNSMGSPLAAGLMSGIQQGVGYYSMYKMK